MQTARQRCNVVPTGSRRKSPHSGAYGVSPMFSGGRGGVRAHAKCAANVAGIVDFYDRFETSCAARCSATSRNDLISIMGP